MKVLILGSQSFASIGLSDLLKEDNHDTQLFTRGEKGRSKDIISPRITQKTQIET